MNLHTLKDLAADLDNLATEVARSSADHGPRHWRDVARVGMALWAEGAEIRDQDMIVVLLFAMLHDTQRLTEFDDPEHGERAARLASRLGNSGGLVDWLDGNHALVLGEALRDHDKGEVADEYDNAITALCWDADRLTLPRVGITPDPKYLSTAVAMTPLAMSGYVAISQRDYTWDEIIESYVNLRPLDSFNPAVPGQLGGDYRQARRAFGADLHPDLKRTLTKVEGDSNITITVIGHRFVHDLYFGEVMNGSYNMKYLVKTRHADEAWARGDYAEYIGLHEKPYRLDALVECVEAGWEDHQAIAEAVASVWVHAENIWQQQAEWREVWDAADINHVMDEEERAAYAALPETGVTIYRGFHREGGEEGMSWTTDRQQAKWFARRWAKAGMAPRIATGKIDRADIFAYFSGRGEDEVVVKAEEVNIINVEEIEE